ncbi:MAG: bifunctional aspartate kinase/homoserine dehydrogenase I [Bacteroidota bacterium]
MLVLKFGGTSVANAERIQQVTAIVKRRLPQAPLVVVVSAFGGVTDALIACSAQAAAGQEDYLAPLQRITDRSLEAVRELLPMQVQSGALAQVRMLLNDLEDVLKGVFLVRELSPKTKDLVLSFGERLSAYIIAEHFKHRGLPAEHFASPDLILTDRNFGDARPDFAATNERIKNRLGDREGIAVVGGFVASHAPKQEITTLGRGGSDYTAAILAAALGADRLEIWTDVNGMLTANPRQVGDAFTIPVVSYDEAMELSHFGAKVIYPPTIQPVRDRNIPIHVGNTFDPEGHYTRIQQDIPATSYPVRGMTSIRDIALLSLSGPGMVGVPGTSRRLFGALARASVNVILITQASSEHSITFATRESHLAAAEAAVNEEFAYEISTGKVTPLKVESGLAIIAIVGENMKNRVGLSGQMFSALGSNGVNIRAIAQGSSERIISAVIEAGDAGKALNVLHEAFFTDTVKAHLFIVGVGTVGRVLLTQIAEQQPWLLDQLGVDLKVVALANTRKIAFSEIGIDLADWKTQLENSAQAMSMGEFVRQMQAANLHNSIFIDNTASAEVAQFYPQILRANISVVTPNKIAASSGYAHYRTLKQTAQRYGVKYLFETNVGAGLPVIGTLKDLIRSGDRIHRIEAVLSGTLNFLFNHFKAGTRFVDIVQQAKAEGYTEPDPRIDLSGVDVMRKILILAREAGYEMEMADIALKSFLPPECQETESIEDFYAQLEAHADHFDALRQAADDKAERLKVAAVLDAGQASVELRSYPQGHPFFELHGKDNIVLFTTDRYREQPLVVKGAGAGAEVTAMGIFADIIRVVNV